MLAVGDEVFGPKRSFMRSRRALEPGGVYVSTDGLRNIALGPISRLGRRRVALPPATSS